MDFNQIKALVHNTLTGHVKDAPITPIEHEAMANAIVDKIEEVDGKVYIADLTNITGDELNAAISTGKVVYANTLYGTVPLAGYELKNIHNEDGSRETVVYFDFKGIHPGKGTVSTTVVEWNRATNTTKTYLRTDNDNIALVDTTWEYDDVKDLVYKGRNVFLARYTENDDDNNLYYSILPFSGICAEHSYMYRTTDDTTSTELQFVGYDAARGCNVKVYCYKKPDGSNSVTLWKTEDANNDIFVFGVNQLPTYKEFCDVLFKYPNRVLVFKYHDDTYVYNSLEKYVYDNHVWPSIVFVRGNNILRLVAWNGPDRPLDIHMETFAGISVDNDGYLVQNADD